MSKVDTKGIEFLEGEPIQRAVARESGRQELAALKRRGKQLRQPANALQGVPSWRLVRELAHRHYRAILAGLFYMSLGAVIVLITKG